MERQRDELPIYRLVFLGECQLMYRGSAVHRAKLHGGNGAELPIHGMDLLGQCKHVHPGGAVCGADELYGWHGDQLPIHGMVWLVWR